MRKLTHVGTALTLGWLSACTTATGPIAPDADAGWEQRSDAGTTPVQGPDAGSPSDDDTQPVSERLPEALDANPVVRLRLPDTGEMLTLESTHVPDGQEAWTQRETLTAEGQLLERTGGRGELLSVTVADPRGEVVEGSLALADCTPDRRDTPVTLAVPEGYRTIQAAIDAADYGDTVRVAPGTYTESLQLRSGVRLVGAGPGQTILEGGGRDQNLIDFTGAHDTVVRGFTLRNVGQADGCSRPEDVLACSGDWYRAAVYADGHHDLNPCTAPSILLMHNVIEANDIGVLLYFHPYAVVRNNIFIGNRAALVANHHGGASSVVTHNVFYANTEHTLAISASYMDILNNIFSTGGTIEQEYVQQGRIRCNVFHESGAGARVSLGTDGNVALDPRFLDPSAWDFHLEAASQALSAGCFGPAGEQAVEAGAHGSHVGAWSER